MVIVRNLVIDDYAHIKAPPQNVPRPVQPSNDTSLNIGATNKSPFRRVKANLKQIMTGLVQSL
jgi:hypothetical protein